MAMQALAARAAWPDSCDVGRRGGDTGGGDGDSGGEANLTEMGELGGD